MKSGRKPRSSSKRQLDLYLQMVKDSDRFREQWAINKALREQEVRARKGRPLATYHDECKTTECHFCGEIKVCCVRDSDTPETETGYVDEWAICGECMAEQRQS